MAARATYSEALSASPRPVGEASVGIDRPVKLARMLATEFPGEARTAFLARAIPFAGTRAVTCCSGNRGTVGPENAVYLLERNAARPKKISESFGEFVERSGATSVSSTGGSREWIGS